MQIKPADRLTDNFPLDYYLILITPPVNARATLKENTIERVASKSNVKDLYGMCYIVFLDLFKKQNYQENTISSLMSVNNV